MTRPADLWTLTTKKTGTTANEQQKHGLNGSPVLCTQPRRAAQIFILTTRPLSAINMTNISADLAQLVEQLICNQWVGGSSPSVGTSLQALEIQGLFLLLGLLNLTQK